MLALGTEAGLPVVPQALKAPWLALARTDAERALFARIRSALDPAALATCQR